MDLELYVPAVIRLVKSGGWRGKAAKVRTPQPRPMFQGYGFLRCDSVTSEKRVKDCDGVMGLLPWRGSGKAARLPHEAIMAIRAKQLEQHRMVLDSKGVRPSSFKPGDMVRVDEGSVYSGLVAKVESIDTKGRIEILLGMIRHTLPADMVVAA
jgi:transcription antitermination factor NusG